ncbi:restriction endonuclease subunit S [Azomonas macrocytogenes]|uniref:Type I restriction enzyme S subunit n=1 Tax=Azomonas macrocytogenes TaxID=69962 RepID=A0A839SZV2_AZOMA|nr:restriction endonuclease subunit S [Azomonas macrocytogenes]MBB3102682.1 type I restriction enzyme S subunit [Azomonas macrocytogenes]
MEVNPGYKQTEVGVIPENWGVYRLSELGAGATPSVKAGPFGSALKKEEYVPTGFKVYGQEQVIRGDYLFGDYFISTNKYRQLESCSVNPGDVLLSLVGTVGKLLEIPKDAPKGIINPRLIRFSFDRSRVLSSYFRYTFESSAVQQELQSRAQGGTMGVLNAGILRSFEIALPGFEEQRAIATTLSDMDALLDGLDRLIAKKRAIKQATMQQLLTGQTRLPGFSGEWEVKRLGDVAHIKTGSKNNEDKAENGDYPFFVRSENIERISSYSYDCEAILVPGEGRIGEIFHYISGKFDVHQRVYAITQFNQDVSGRFVHLYLSANFGAWAMQNTVKATVDSLRLPTFLDFQMCIPPTVEEQIAIATVLTDMDTEITTLETHRTKTRALKQAMMQELLTGRTRLI